MFRRITNIDPKLYPFAFAIRKRREAKGFSTVQIAGMVGVTPQAVSFWENGSSAPTYDRAKKLAKVLGIAFQRLESLHTKQVSIKQGAA